MRANAKCISPDGISYTIWSVRAEWVGPRGRKVTQQIVRAYTHDLSEDNANGNLDGIPVHWVVLPLNRFEAMFSDMFSERKES